MLDAATAIALAMLAVSVLIALARLVQGPTLLDRVVAVDLIGVLIVGMIVVVAARIGQQAFLDVAIVIALISFVGTIAYARYVEREGRS